MHPAVVPRGPPQLRATRAGKGRTSLSLGGPWSLCESLLSRSCYISILTGAPSVGSRSLSWLCPASVSSTATPCSTHACTSTSGSKTYAALLSGTRSSYYAASGRPLQWPRSAAWSPAGGVGCRPTTQRPAGPLCAIASTTKTASVHTTSDGVASGSNNARAGGDEAQGSGRNDGGTGGVAAGARLQPVDYSTLAACCLELRKGWVPAKVEQVVMPDKTSLCLRLRTPSGQGWLRVSWHPTGGRVTMMADGSAPERGNASELYSLGEQVHGALGGLVLVGVALPAPWERVADLQFGVRPGEPPTHHLYCEVMARYSNVILTSASGEVLSAAYQVGGMMSSHRQVQVGRTYTLPPQLFGVPPTAAASLDTWRETLQRAAALAAAQQRDALEQRRAAAAAKAAAKAAGKSSLPKAGAAAGSLNAASSTVVDAGQPGEPSGVGRATAATADGPPAAAVGGEEGTLVDGFVRAFHGVSPALVGELCRGSGLSAGASPAALSAAQWEALYGGWVAWQERLRSGDFAATSDPETGRYSVFGSLPRRHASVHALLEDYYGPMAASEVHGQLHARLASVVAAALKKARGKVRAFEQQLSESSRVGDIQRRADMITANLYRIPAGSATAEVEDWDTGEPVVLELDPKQPPVATAEALYRKARKLRRAVDAVQPLLEESQAEVSYFEEVEVGLAGLKRWSGDAADLTALREVQDELVAGKYMKPPSDAALAAKTAARATKAAARAAKGGAKKGGGKAGGGGAAAAAAAAAAGGVDSASARRYTSPGGFTVLVGRNNKQNDIISTQLAAPDDLWFHVRGMPGSHTLLRLPSGARPGEEDVQFAADLAAFFSRARDTLKADVIVARGAWVRKPRGAKPGAVSVTKELRNVVARPGDSAAARLGEEAQGAGR